MTWRGLLVNPFTTPSSPLHLYRLHLYDIGLIYIEGGEQMARKQTNMTLPQETLDRLDSIAQTIC